MLHLTLTPMLLSSLPLVYAYMVSLPSSCLVSALPLCCPALLLPCLVAVPVLYHASILFGICAAHTPYALQQSMLAGPRLHLLFL